MKSIALMFFSIFIIGKIHAQECDDQRYFEEIFDVDVTSNIKFGEAPQPTIFNPNNIEELFMDVYQPEGDELEARPLIIWAFGGAFVFGSKDSPDIVTLSNSFARRGYVCAAIDYRVTLELLINSDPEVVYRATLKATHDMLASIRYMYKDAAEDNTLKIDTNRIYVGGVSAGAITALQVAHFDELSEVPAEIETFFEESGGFEGNSGNPGYSSDIAGVINLCGAVIDTSWINPEISTPIVSTHGTADDVVPYGSDMIGILDINLEVDGSSIIHDKLDLHDIKNDLYTYQGAGHTPFVGDQAYMDTTITFVRDFMYDIVCGDLTSSEEVVMDESLSLDIFPNPNDGNFFIRSDSDEPLSVTVYDQFGRKVYFNPALLRGDNRFDLDLPAGFYIVSATSMDGSQVSSEKLIVR